MATNKIQIELMTFIKEHGYPHEFLNDNLALKNDVRITTPTITKEKLGEIHYVLGEKLQETLKTDRKLNHLLTRAMSYVLHEPAKNILQSLYNNAHPKTTKPLPIPPKKQQQTSYNQKEPSAPEELNNNNEPILYNQYHNMIQPMGYDKNPSAPVYDDDTNFEHRTSDSDKMSTGSEHSDGDSPSTPKTERHTKKDPIIKVYVPEKKSNDNNFDDLLKRFPQFNQYVTNNNGIKNQDSIKIKNGDMKDPNIPEFWDSNDFDHKEDTKQWKWHPLWKHVQHEYDMGIYEKDEYAKVNANNLQIISKAIDCMNDCLDYFNGVGTYYRKAYPDPLTKLSLNDRYKEHLKNNWYAVISFVDSKAEAFNNKWLKYDILLNSTIIGKFLKSYFSKPNNGELISNSTTTSVKNKKALVN